MAGCKDGQRVTGPGQVAHGLRAAPSTSEAAYLVLECDSVDASLEDLSNTSERYVAYT
jgi:hypothetical protein